MTIFSLVANDEHTPPHPKPACVSVKPTQSVGDLVMDFLDYDAREQGLTTDAILPPDEALTDRIAAALALMRYAREVAERERAA